MKSRFLIGRDIKSYLEASLETVATLSIHSGISTSLINLMLHDVYQPSNEILERFYSYIFKQGLRINEIKSEIYQERLGPKEHLFFYGTQGTIKSLSLKANNKEGDFGIGLSCLTSLSKALSSVCEGLRPSVYLWSADFSGLKIQERTCDLDWMLSLGFYHGFLADYVEKAKIKKLEASIEDFDVIIAPGVDHKMLQIIRQFSEGELNSEQALHALAPSIVGNQWFLKTQAALDRLNLKERYFISESEKEEAVDKALEREAFINSKLSVAKREFRREGRSIKEILK